MKTALLALADALFAAGARANVVTIDQTKALAGGVALDRGGFAVRGTGCSGTLCRVISADAHGITGNYLRVVMAASSPDGDW
jgi:hypothetical protein